MAQGKPGDRQIDYNEIRVQHCLGEEKEGEGPRFLLQRTWWRPRKVNRRNVPNNLVTALLTFAAIAGSLQFVAPIISKHKLAARMEH